MVISFTGHRPSQITNRLVVIQALRNVLLSLPVSLAYSGMAVGVDQWAAEICTELRIPWIAAIPCDRQEAIWPPASQEHYHKLLALAAGKVVVSPGAYANWKMQTRNCYLVDSCDVLIAVFRSDKNSGGTKNCVDYARKVGKRIWRIDPCIL